MVCISAMMWTHTPEGMKCNKHPGPAFGSRAGCPRCLEESATDPMDELDSNEPIIAPSDTLSAIDLEREQVAIAIRSRDRAMADDGPLGAKYFDTAIKAFRAAGELCAERERMERLRRIEKLQRAMKHRAFH